MFERAAQCIGMSAIALGVAVLVGWANGVLALIHVRPNLAAMQPITALCFILTGAGVLAADRSRAQTSSRIVRIGVASVLVMLSFSTLAEYAFNAQFSIGHMWIGTPFAPGHSPGRMAVATATSFALIGVALGLADTPRHVMLREGAVLLAGAVALLSLTGYMYGVTALYGVGFYSSMAVHTAVGLLALSVALICARPQGGIVALLVSDTAGGVLARRLLPLALGAPFLIGWLGIEGERAYLYHSDFGMAITSVAYVALFSFSIWRTARALERLDAARRDAERDKLEQQAQMQGLIDSAMDGIIMVDGEQTILVFNRAAEKLFDYKASDIVGSQLDVLMPQRFRSPHGAHVRRFDADQSYSRRMGAGDFITGLRADGTEFPIEVSISKFESAEGIRYTAIVRDVTERNNAQCALKEAARREWMRAEELSKLLNAVPAAVCFAHDPLAAELSGNALYHAWFRGAEADAGDATAADDSCPVNAPQVLARSPGVDALLQAAQGHELRDHELSCVNADGTTRHLLGNALPLFDEDGAVIGAISAFIDVTARKESELTMLAATAANIAKTTFITHLTHELRTPLNTMLGHAQMMELTKIPPTAAQLKSIKQILSAGWYMRNLINDVQNVAAIEAAGIAMSGERTAIDQALSEVASMLEPLFLKSDVHLELPPASGLQVAVNPMRIRQVLINLLSNAIKYNRPGGRITVKCAAAAPDSIRISVEDTGYGLSPEKLAQLFQPFNRLGQESGGKEGTGVGLVVTKELVEAMGGTIGVDSMSGRGTLVWFCLPCSVDCPVEEEQV